MSSKTSTQYKEDGNIAFQNQEYLEALEHYSIAISMDRSNASFWGNRSTTYYNLGLYDKAIEDVSHAIDLSPKNERFYYRKGQAHLQLGQLYAAKLAFQNGLAQAPNSEQLKTALRERKVGELAYQGNNANMTVEQKKEKSQVLKADGNKLFGLKKYFQAAEKYSQAIELDPSESVFYNNRAACYTELKRFDDAINDTKFAITLGKTNGINSNGTTSTDHRLLAKAYFRQGHAYVESKKFEKAVKSLEFSLKEENSEVVREKLAEVKKLLEGEKNK